MKIFDKQGKVIREVSGDTLRDANLRDAYLRDADLRGADLRGADLRDAYLRGAYLRDAYLRGAYLRDAYLRGAILPDGRTYEEYTKDPLAGICDESEARARALASWGKTSWTSCPMHAAHGWTAIEQAPEDKRRAVETFIALHDANLLPKPEGK